LINAFLAWAASDEIGRGKRDLIFSRKYPDHIGNVEMFPQSLLLVRRPEYEWPNPLGVGRFKPEHPAKKLEDDYDVFRDGRDGHLRLNARVIVNHFI
jgi:hypothetical protein